MTGVSFYNNSAETIPPFAVMQVQDTQSVAGRTVVKVGKPTGDSNAAGYLLNGPVSIPAGKTGIGFTASNPTWAFYDDADTPSNGDDWGAESGSWKLLSGNTGFRVVGGATGGSSDIVLVRVVGSGGGFALLGPCVAFTPDIGDPDTDFGTTYPDGCEGPDRLGVYLTNPSGGSVMILECNLESTGPLTLTSDSFTLACKSGSISCYVKIVITSTDLGGVVATVNKVSDDSVVAAYRNAIYSWYPDQAGNVQMGPDSSPCVCGTLPYDLCIAIPNR